MAKIVREKAGVATLRGRRPAPKITSKIPIEIGRASCRERV